MCEFCLMEINIDRLLDLFGKIQDGVCYEGLRDFIQSVSSYYLLIIKIVINILIFNVNNINL